MDLTPEDIESIRKVAESQFGDALQAAHNDFMSCDGVVPGEAPIYDTNNPHFNTPENLALLRSLNPDIPSIPPVPTGPDMDVLAQQVEWLCHQMMFIRQLIDGIMSAASSNPMARAMLARMNGGKQ